MYHGAGYRKLGKKTAHRMAMFSNMANSLIEHERIKTTLPKAKEIRRLVERLVTKGKDGSVASRRRAFSFLRDEKAVTKLFDTLAPRFKDRNGGYTRILKSAATRLGDGASVAYVEFVDYVLPAQQSKDDKKKRRAEKKATAKEQKKSNKVAKGSTGAEKAAAKKAAKTGKAGASSSMKGSGSRGS